MTDRPRLVTPAFMSLFVAALGAAIIVVRRSSLAVPGSSGPERALG